MSVRSFLFVVAFAFGLAGITLGEDQINKRGSTGRDGLVFRVWNSARSSRSVEAALVNYEDGLVSLQSRSGRVVTGQIEKLSAPDRRFVEQSAAARNITTNGEVDSVSNERPLHFVAMRVANQQDELDEAIEAIENLLAVAAPPSGTIDGTQLAGVLRNTHSLLRTYKAPARIEPKEEYVWGYRYVWRRGCFGRRICQRIRVRHKVKTEDKYEVASPDLVYQLELVEEALDQLGTVDLNDPVNVRQLKLELLRAYGIISGAN